jgi:hypothetical protein
MIKDLVKLANSLDEIGLNKYSDRIDATIEKLKKEAQDSSVAPEGSTGWELTRDLARKFVLPIAGAVEAAKSLSEGRSVYESVMPNFLKSVEDFMARKGPLLKDARSSFVRSSAEESSKKGADALKKEIRELVESMDYFFGGSWTTPNYYRNLEKISPKLYSLSWSLGFGESTSLERSEVGLTSVVDNLSSRTTSYVSTDYREAGRWIMWQIIKEGFKAGETARGVSTASVPQATIPSNTPPSGTPSVPVAAPPIYRDRPHEIVLIGHKEGTVLSDLDYTYKVVNDLEFKWFRKSDEKTGNFSWSAGNTEQWNEAATIINSLSPAKPGEGKQGEVSTQPSLTAPVAPSADNSLNNVEIILARINAGATFAIGTLQNEMARLRRLIEGGMSIPDIAKEIVRQNSIALTKSSLASAKPDDLNKMSNGDIKRAYRTEVDLIMSTINRIFKAKK